MVSIYNSSKVSAMANGRFTKSKSTGADSCMVISGDTTDSVAVFCYNDLY
jgi:hypothetical protein